MAGTMVLVKRAGVVQLGLVVFEDACAKGRRQFATTASNKVETGFISCESE